MIPRPAPNREPEPQTAVLVTIHGRIWPGTLRGRSWSEEHQEWRCSVELWVDDRGVIVSVADDQVEFVAGPMAQGF